MITYAYQSESCGRYFEFRRAITEESVEECPECRGKLNLMVSGGSGFVIKESSPAFERQTGGNCSFKSSGKTCCGRTERCGKPSCGTQS